MRKEDFVDTIEWLRGQSKQASTLNKEIESIQNQADQIDFKIENTIKALSFVYGEESIEELERIIYIDIDEPIEELYESINKQI